MLCLDTIEEMQCVQTKFLEDHISAFCSFLQYKITIAQLCQNTLFSRELSRLNIVCELMILGVNILFRIVNAN